MAQVTTIEVKVVTPNHAKIVDIRTVGKDHTGAVVGSNGIRWNLNN